MNIQGAGTKETVIARRVDGPESLYRCRLPVDSIRPLDSVDQLRFWVYTTDMRMYGMPVVTPIEEMEGFTHQLLRGISARNACKHQGQDMEVSVADLSQAALREWLPVAARHDRGTVRVSEKVTMFITLSATHGCSVEVVSALLGLRTGEYEELSKFADLLPSVLALVDTGHLPQGHAALIAELPTANQLEMATWSVGRRAKMVALQKKVHDFLKRTNRT